MVVYLGEKHVLFNVNQHLNYGGYRKLMEHMTKSLTKPRDYTEG